jgi:plastocyanin
MRPLLLVMTWTMLAPTASGEVHVVEAHDMTFKPEVVQVAAGDTIRWEYVSGTPHTVSSGSSCRWDGGFFGVVSIVEPVFEWTVPEDAPPEIPYFCAPHCVGGMVGTIIVERPCIEDRDGSGIVDGEDLLVVLANWGGADPAGDVDGDGVVDGADLLQVLGAWGPCD